MATVTAEETIMGTTDRPADYTPLTRDEQTAIARASSIEVILTGIDAGHRMAGMALTDDDKGDCRRIARCLNRRSRPASPQQRHRPTM